MRRVQIVNEVEICRRNEGRKFIMTKRMVHFFESPGEGNTDKVIKAILDRAKEGDIEAVIVASISGDTSVKVAEQLKKSRLNIKVVCVTGPSSWQKYPQYKFPLIKEEERKKMDTLGIQVIDWVEEPFKPIAFRNWWEEKTVEMLRPESDLFWMTLICVGGHGFRTAVEVVFMSVEAKITNEGDKVIGIAGTGTGADTAIVMKASRFEDAVGADPEKRMKIHEILAMPKETTWTAYG
jgi:hypothetical protein